MATKTNYWFQDREGAIHKRSSHSRVFSHVVVVKFKERTDKYGHILLAHKYAQWASTEALARKVANLYGSGGTVEWVELGPVSTGPLLLAQLLPRVG